MTRCLEAPPKVAPVREGVRQALSTRGTSLGHLNIADGFTEAVHERCCELDVHTQTIAA
jgi:hypothetical protein